MPVTVLGASAGPPRSVNCRASLRPPPAVRALLSVRFFVGDLFGWDQATPSSVSESFAQRLTDKDRARSLAPAGTPDGLFRIVYRFENEQLDEIINRAAHVPLICDLAPTPIVYKRNFLMRGDEFNKEDGAIDFDVVTELVFPDRAAYLAWAAQLSKPGSGERVVADELKFLDRSRTRAYVVEECVTSG